MLGSIEKYSREFAAQRYLMPFKPPPRVGGMQLTQLIYIIGANLALSQRVKKAFSIYCGKSVSEGEEKKRRRLLSNQNLQVYLLEF